MPATFPPEPVDGLLVAGFDAPVSTGSSARAGERPGALRGDRRAHAARGCAPSSTRRAAGEGWHERAAERLVARVAQKTRRSRCEALAQLRAAGRAPDLVCVVFSESDTVAHHFWRDHDPASPRHDPRALARRGAAPSPPCTRRSTPPAASCAPRSATDAALLRRLRPRQRRRRAPRRAPEPPARGVPACSRRRGGAARATGSRAPARDAALRVLPPRAREAAFRRAARRRRARSRAPRASAASTGARTARVLRGGEHAARRVDQPARARGRPARVAPADYERVRADVIDALLDWKLPAAAPVVARARRREEVYAGPLVARAPDVVVELALDARLRPLAGADAPRRRRRRVAALRSSDHELAGGRGRGMNGTHRPEGIWIEHGARARPRFASGAAPRSPTPRRDPRRARPRPRRGARRQRRSAPAARLHAPRRRRSSRERLRRLGYLDSDAHAAPELSLVFPVFDEEENLGPLLDERRSRSGAALGRELRDRGGGRRQPRRERARDRRAPRALHPEIRAVHHAANRGYGAALRSGLREARGELVFFSDADLQFDLDELERAARAHRRLRHRGRLPRAAARSLGPARARVGLGHARERALRPRRARHRLRLQAVPPRGARRDPDRVARRLREHRDPGARARGGLPHPPGAGDAPPAPRRPPDGREPARDRCARCSSSRRSTASCAPAPARRGAESVPAQPGS